MKRVTLTTAVWLLVCLSCNRVAAQAEVSGWGNLRGIRVGGQLVAFTTAVGIFNPDFSQVTFSQREGPLRTSQYLRNGNSVTVGESLQYGAAAARGGATNTAGGLGRRGGPGGRGGGSGFSYTITYTDSAPGVCEVSLKISSTTDQTVGGIYYLLDFPARDFADGALELPTNGDYRLVPLKTPGREGRYMSASSTAFRLSGKNHQQVEVNFGKAVVEVSRTNATSAAGQQVKVSLDNHLPVVVQPARISKNPNVAPDDIEVYFPIAVGNTTAGQTYESHFTLKASGDVEAGPVTVTVDPSRPGRTFDGMGGNYRIQGPRDPQHIQYILDNMRVAFGRVALPWNVWQPEENSPPPLLADTNAATAPAPAAGGGRGGRGGRGGGGMNFITSAMEIAQKLAKLNIPTIISCWSPPSWAVVANDPRVSRFGGTERGQHLDPAKWDAICKSIGSYLVFLRDHYGAEPRYFSFNESDLGIDVHQSPQEHDQAIKMLGAYFKSAGLKTRMLLGDTSDAVPAGFIQPALNDPEAVQYIGAVSFHSWRGATDEQYQKWADAAAKLGLPLFDAEGGNDAQASSYPNVFREAWYALDEAAEYVRIMRICQPEAILEWQLTENYSVLKQDAGGALQPTQRFHNLKQFNLAPAGSAWLPAQSSSALVLPAAAADPARSLITVHLVNNGASRPATLAGLPASVAQMSLYVTDEKRGMEKLDPVAVQNGSAHFTLPAQALTTLINAR
jgi:O-glycosyl hydrolase